jgi:hypothetical protein
LKNWAFTGKFADCKFARYIKPTILPLTISIGFLSLLVYTCSDSPVHERQGAERALKVLDSDINAFVDQVGQDESFRCLSFLLDQPSAPIPFKRSENKRIPEDTLFSLATHSGNYSWERDSSGFIKTAESDSVIIRFPVPEYESKQAVLVISTYEVGPGTSRPPFPEQLAASLMIDDEEKVKIYHQAETAGRLISQCNTIIEAGRLRAEMTFDRTRNGDRGDFSMSCRMEAAGKTLLEGSINGELGYSHDSYYFITIHPDLRVFDVLFIGTLYYGNIDPTAPNYADSFNSICGIEIIDLTENKLIGHFGMAAVEEGDLYDYTVIFADRSSGFLKDYLLFARKLTEYKYQ